MTYHAPIALNPDSTVKELARAAFPSYRGRTFHLQVHDDEMELSGTYWDGGSRSSYSAVTLSDPPRAQALPQWDPPQFGGPRETPRVTIPEGAAVAEHAVFCGKDMGVTFHVRPGALVDALAPTAPTDLTDAEAVVLRCVACLKSSARREYAAEGGVSRDEYERTVASLKDRGFLRKNGGITPDGRNVADTLRERVKTLGCWA